MRALMIALYVAAVLALVVLVNLIADDHAALRHLPGAM